MKFFCRICFILCFLVISFFLTNLWFHEIFITKSLVIPYSLKPFDICAEYPIAWNYIKIIYITLVFTTTLIVSNTLFSRFFNNLSFKKKSLPIHKSDLFLKVGNSFVYENGLYQNFLITGSIGSGKTSSAMYPFSKQLISYNSFSPNNKIRYVNSRC